MNLAALLSSKNGNYCTPPRIVSRLHRFLKDKAKEEHERAGAVWDGKVPPFGDPYSNGASIVGAAYTCSRESGTDGNAVDWGTFVRPHGDRAFVYKNPEYGSAIAAALATTHRYGRDLRSCEIISLLPNRPDTAWCQDHVHGSADAWIDIRGRLTFWLPIPIEDPRPWEERRRSDEMPVFLQRWWPDASDTNLPEPFRLLEPGIAVGPELGKEGTPQPAPFPSLLGYWGDDIRRFARHFGTLGTLTVRCDGVAMPAVPADDLLAVCPPDVVAYVQAARRRATGVYQMAGVREQSA